GRRLGGLVGSQAVEPRASNVARSPPDGNDEASGSPLTSSLPENSAIAVPSPFGLMKLSCFSAVWPVIGWNWWVKWVAPFSTAQSRMAAATASATSGLSGAPCLMVFCSALKIGLGSRSRWAASPQTISPNRCLRWRSLSLMFGSLRGAVAMAGPPAGRRFLIGPRGGGEYPGGWLGRGHPPGRSQSRGVSPPLAGLGERNAFLRGRILAY